MTMFTKYLYLWTPWPGPELLSAEIGIEIVQILLEIFFRVKWDFFSCLSHGRSKVLPGFRDPLANIKLQILVRVKACWRRLIQELPMMMMSRASVRMSPPVLCCRTEGGQSGRPGSTDLQIYRTTGTNCTRTFCKLPTLWVLTLRPYCVTDVTR